MPPLQLVRYLQSYTHMHSCLWLLRQCPGVAPGAHCPQLCSPGLLGPHLSFHQLESLLHQELQGLEELLLQPLALASRLPLLQWPEGLELQMQ